jgi:hypothetical protein
MIEWAKAPLRTIYRKRGLTLTGCQERKEMELTSTEKINLVELITLAKHTLENRIIENRYSIKTQRKRDWSRINDANRLIRKIMQ